ncbi:MAG: hypothetical protein EBR82_35215, partial [Caulobacteraceae bacterium]|nr:hypothetical protein [Caulobacteraceae bacterium]
MSSASAQTLADKLGAPITEGGKITFPKGYSANQFNAVITTLQPQLDALNQQKTTLAQQLQTLHSQMKRTFSLTGGTGYTGTKDQIAQETALQKQLSDLGSIGTASTQFATTKSYSGTIGALQQQIDSANTQIGKVESQDLSKLKAAQDAEERLYKQYLTSLTDETGKKVYTTTQVNALVKAEDKANATEYNNFKTNLAAVGYQDLSAIHTRPMTIDEMASTPYAQENGFTKEVLTELVSKKLFTLPDVPTGNIYSTITSVDMKTADQYLKDAVTNTDNRVQTALTYLNQYNLDQRFKSGDTTIGFAIDQVANLQSALADGTISPEEKQLIGKGLTNFYNKAGAAFGGTNIPAEQLGAIKPVKNAPGYFSKGVNQDKKGGYTIYYKQNPDGTYSYQSTSYSFTPTGDSGFLGLGKVGDFLLSAGLAWATGGIGGAITGFGANATAGQLAINAAIGSIVSNVAKSIITGQDLSLQNILTSAGTAGLARYVGEAVSNNDLLKDLSPTTRNAIIGASVNAAVTLARTGDLGATFNAAAEGGAQGAINTQVDSWFANGKLAIPGFGDVDVSKMDDPTLNIVKNAISNVLSDVTLRGGNLGQAFITALGNAGFQLAKNELKPVVTSVVDQAKDAAINNYNNLRTKTLNMFADASGAGGTMTDVGGPIYTAPAVDVVASKIDDNILNNIISRAVDRIQNWSDSIDTKKAVFDLADSAIKYFQSTGNKTLIDTAATALKAGGGLLQAVAGLAVFAGQNPDATGVGKLAKQLVDLGNASNTPERAAILKEMNANVAAATGFSGTIKALYENFEKAPMTFLTEAIGVDAMQEVAPLLVGGGAGALARGAGLIAKWGPEFASGLVKAS